MVVGDGSNGDRRAEGSSQLADERRLAAELGSSKGEREAREGDEQERRVSRGDQGGGGKEIVEPPDGKVTWPCPRSGQEQTHRRMHSTVSHR